MQRRAVDLFRKKTDRQIFFLLDDPDAPQMPASEFSDETDFADVIAKKEDCEKLYRAVAQLREPTREIFIRRYYMAQKPAAIAQIMDLPIKAINNRLNYGKSSLKPC